MRKGLIVIIGLIFLTLSNHQAMAQKIKQKVSPEVLTKGKDIYGRKCAICHGLEGKGDGEAEFVLYPRPRDFGMGSFKIRFTPSGSLPTDEDLFRTLTRGIPGTSMPSWESLSADDRWALVHYIKTLSPRFREEEPESPITIGKELPNIPESVAKGKEVYEKMKCWECHGYTGKGDGPSAPTLKDDWGIPIKAYDFTKPGKYKGGDSSQDIYRTFVTGMDGTPMPSYGDSLNEEERWHLVHYVLSLAGKGIPPTPKETGVITSKFTDAKLTEDPNDPIWERVPLTEILLRSLWSKDEPIERVRVGSINNGKAIAFFMEWEDPIVDKDFLRPEDFRDAAAIQFPLSLAEPFHGMGEKDRLVNIWHWKADWQEDLEKFRDIETVYPAMSIDAYPFQRGERWWGRRDVKERLGSAPEQDKVFLAGWGADNLFSSPVRRSAVEDLNAGGLGTLTSQLPENQDVKGRGFWSDGKWRVVFVRALSSKDKNDANFLLNKAAANKAATKVAFAVWNGSQGDRDGKKSISFWQGLKIEKSPKK